MCKQYDYQNNIYCITQSLYYNFIRETPTKLFDHLYLGMGKAKEKVKYLVVDKLPRHLAWTDAAFGEKKFRDMLDIIVGFSSNDKVEKIKDNLLDINSTITPNRVMIQKIKEGIKNGTIIKEYQPDGTYVWKKIRK